MFHNHLTHFLHNAVSVSRDGLLLAALLLTASVQAQTTFDVCGCASYPSLGNFDTADSSTYPPGTQRTGTTITLPARTDGLYVFDSVRLRFITGVGNPIVRFARNDANTPITLLVKGDMTLDVNSTLDVSGDNGVSGSAGGNGTGGLGGPGGFRGGDGAYQLVNFASDGGTGFGPGGGAAGTASPLTNGAGGTFFGSTSLLPLVGGGGGGGGASSSSANGCSGSGGGGGGGALLIAVNGTLTINGTISADGGRGGSLFNPSCASNGGGGSGGAIRLLAQTIAGTANGFLSADGGIGSGLADGQNGAIRMEAFTNHFPANRTTPVASRAPAPGPITPPLTQTVAITSVNAATVSLVNNQPLTQLPQGVFGLVDVFLPSAGLVDIGLRTVGIPANTRVAVTLKPRVGGSLISTDTVLAPANCGGNGACNGLVQVNLPAGAYLIEARATFQP